MYKSDRDFRLWAYHVSHSWALIRSPKTDEQDKNIDIVFWGVQYVGVPIHMNGISLHSQSILPKSLSGTASDTDRKIYISSEGNQHQIIAAGCRVYENSFELFDTDVWNPCMDGGPLGKLIKKI